MATSNEEKTESMPSTSQEPESKPIIKSPKVSMPSVVLTRIDEGGIDLKTALEKAVSIKKKKGRPAKVVKQLVKLDLSKSITKKAPVKNIFDTRGRGLPKKDYSLLADIKPRPKVNSSIKKNLKKAAVSTGITKPYKESAKSLLKKTTLLKRSKITIPPVKKPKSVIEKSGTENKKVKLSMTSSKTEKVPTLSKSEKTPPSSSKSRKTTPSLKDNKKTPEPSKGMKTIKNNLSPPKPKLLPMKSTDSDSSDDEFLYDELIEELENTNKSIFNVKPAGESSSKTTNITLKPNTGNKPPTIVKGGIVKRTDLPPDLKSIASPSKTLIVASKRKAAFSEEIPAKKPSPWPISVSPKKASLQKKAIVEAKNQIIADSFDSSSITLPQIESVSSTRESAVINKSSITTVRPKIGPKQTAKVVPLSKPFQDDYLSDEYTEIETLDEAEHLIVKANFIKNSSQDIKTNLVKPTSRTSSREDSNQDLLKILSDDTENPPPNETELFKKSNLTAKERIEENHTPNEIKIQHDSVESRCSDNVEPETESSSLEIQVKSTYLETQVKSTSLETQVKSTPLIETDNQTKPVETKTQSTNIETEVNNLHLENVPHETSEESTNQNMSDASYASNTVVDTFRQNEEIVGSKKNPPVYEEPPVRTVYDLMNDVSLKYPSWNLHIIPETNAFCIAQVTKGRLGLPTLKKCIELDPESYFAKVYIHQYHIKRFDNVYDSEESILALIEEIHSIKA